jgi:shikimate kinase
MHLALVGLPGSGKTTTGRRVAKALNRPFLDFDQEIERKEGKSVAEIFASHVEEYFRLLEARLSEDLAKGPSMVLAPGGGWMTRLSSVAGLRARTRIIWLRVSAEAALVRMGRNVRLRPLLSGEDPVGELRRLEREREAVYATADASIHTETLTLQEVTDEIARLAAHWGMRVG